MAAAVILCVDDEKNNRDLLRAVLVPRGFEVVEAADGQRALNRRPATCQTACGPRCLDKKIRNSLR